jgi:hypothetical protein
MSPAAAIPVRASPLGQVQDSGERQRLPSARVRTCETNPDTKRGVRLILSGGARS